MIRTLRRVCFNEAVGLAPEQSYISHQRTAIPCSEGEPASILPNRVPVRMTLTNNRRK